MRYGPRALLAGGLGFALSWLVACGGGSGLLSGDQSSTLNSQLDSISAAVSSGQCVNATQALAAFSNAVTNLPATVSPTLRANLAQGASTVGALAQRDCRTNASKSTTSSTTTPTTTTNPQSTSTQTSTTTTTTTTSSSTTGPATSTSTTGSTSTTSTSGGAGVGGGNGNGNGNGNSGGAGSGIIVGNGG